MKELIDRGARVSYVDDLGRNATYYATIFGISDVLGLLLDTFPAEIHRKTFDGLSLLTYAFIANAETSAVLIKRGARNPIFWWLLAHSMSDTVHHHHLATRFQKLL